MLDEVAVARGGRTLWSDASFHVDRGAAVAVIGPNGSGKTTFLKLILGAIAPSQGTVHLFGAAPHCGNPRVGYVPQTTSATVAEAVRGRDLVSLGLSGHQWGPPRRSATARSRVDEALAHVGATEFADKRLSTLSGGQQQRIAIARALVGQPDLLLLDEPLANLDLMSQHNVVSILQHLQRVHGMTMIIVAHDLTPLRSLVTSAVYLLAGHARCVPLSDIDSDLLVQLNGWPPTREHTDVEPSPSSN